MARHRRRQWEHLAERRRQRRRWVRRLLSALERKFRRQRQALDLADRGGGVLPLDNLRHIEVPARFSFVDNTDECLRMLRDMRVAAVSSRGLWFDMSRVVAISPDAVNVLLARIEDNRITRGRPVFGNVPRDPDVARQLADLSFFEYVRADRPAPRSSISRLRRRGQFRVEPYEAAAAVEFASRALLGESRRAPAVYRTIIECMANTQNHASLSVRERERWWLGVAHDPAQRRCRFTFIDNGAGVFNTLRLRIGLSILREAGLTDNVSLARDLFGGGIGSRTGLRNRGKGLPTIYKACRTGQIHNLVLISNDVYVDVGRDLYRRLSLVFQGTFLTWEVYCDDPFAPVIDEVAKV